MLLTPEGIEFAHLARHVVDTFDTGMRHFAGFLDGTRGVVRVATLPSLAATLLPAVIAAFRRDNPAVQVNVVDALLGEVLDAVRGGRVDLAITVLTEPTASLDFRPIAVDDFSCVFPPGHRFESTNTLEWSDLQGEQFISFAATSSIRSHVDHALDDAGVVLGPVTEARNIAAVGGLVAAGLGISAVPALVLPLLEFANLESRPLEAPERWRTIGVVTDPHRPLSAAVHRLQRTVLDAAQRELALPDGARWLTTG